jgi:hypothetical protein
MITTISQVIIFLFGVATCIVCALGIYAPKRLIEAVMSIWEKPWGIYVAVIVRLFLGALLILAAPDARFPAVFKVLGWLSIIAAVLIPTVGRTRLNRIINWFTGLSLSLVRFWLLFGIAFGGFLIFCLI